jgi:hypothetical protein
MGEKREYSSSDSFLGVGAAGPLKMPVAAISEEQYTLKRPVRNGFSRDARAFSSSRPRPLFSTLMQGFATSCEHCTIAAATHVRALADADGRHASRVPTDTRLSALKITRWAGQSEMSVCPDEQLLVEILGGKIC